MVPIVVQLIALKFKVAKAVQLAKAKLSIVVTPFGMVIEVRAGQSKKLYPLIVVTLFGIFTEVKLLQLEKAEFPIVVTLFGIVTEVKLLHSEKVPFSIVVMPFDRPFDAAQQAGRSLIGTHISHTGIC